jgi:CheY-specific phosphatase CheX
MANLSSILNDPNYVNANAETKAAIFDKFSAQDKNYTGANSETQQAIRVKFGIESAATPELSMREKIMGAIETPFALGATLAGGAIAPIVGVAGTLASGKYGTQEGIRAGEEAAKSVMYQPRTQVARQALSAVGEFLQPVTNALPPTLGATGSTINALAPAVATQANVLARPIVRQATVPVQNALAKVMTREEPPAMVGMGAANTAEDLMRQQRLEQFGIRATAGEREKNLQKQQFESDVQRGALPGVSEDVKAKLGREYGAFKVGQKQDILNQFERMTEEVGGTIDRSTPRAVGTVVDKALINIYTKKFDDYKAKYAKADNAGETLEQVPYQSLLDYIGTKSATRREKLDPILNDVAELLAMNDPQKTGAISIRNLDDIYQVIGTAKDSPSAKPLKDLITQISDGVGGKLYQEARQARTQLAKQFEDVDRVDKLLSTKAGKTDRKVALDDVYSHIVTDGSLEEMRTVTSLLKKTPEGQQAYKELQGYTLQKMKDLLLKQGDETDNIRLNNFNNFVTQLDREDKLGYMFGKTGRDTLLDLKKTIGDVMVKEPGAVNYPNTAGAVLRGLEALQNLPVKIPGTQTAAEFARGMQYKKQLKESLEQPNQLAPKQTNQNALANQPFRMEIRGTGKK